MVYQVNKSEDKEHSYLAIKEVKPNNKRVLSVISKSRGKSNGFSRTGGLGSFDLSIRRALSRSKRADSRELKSQKTTRTKKRSKSLEVRRSTHSRPLGIQVSMTKSSSNPEGNRSVTRERTRKNDSVRTRALSIDRPQSRRKIFSSERPSSRGRSRNPSRQNHVENNSSNEKVINSKPTEKETSMVLSSIQTSDSKNIEMPTLGDRSTSNDDDQLDSDILMKEKMKNATKSSCNAIDVSMLRVESSLATWAFSCSDTLQEFMTALPKRVGSFCKYRFKCYSFRSYCCHQT